MKSAFLLVGAFALSLNVALGAITPTDLKCEYTREPLGIDAPRPRLSWVLKSDRPGDGQTAYQVLVASNPEKLAKDEGDLWDSGKVASGESVHVVYGGRALESRQECLWKVRAWDTAGAASAWSKPTHWEMALLSPDDWQAQWINDGKANPTKDEDFYREDPAPLFRKEFTVDKDKKVRRARLYISGLGYYKARFNGGCVECGDVLDPGWTRYSRRVLYSTYDLTSRLEPGRNCIGVTLGNGWYNPLPLRMWGHLNLREHLPVGRPRFIARLEVEFTDGTRQAITSDTSWRVADGPLRFNNIYLGNIYDARKEVDNWAKPGFDDNAWRQAALATEPIGRLVAQSRVHTLFSLSTPYDPKTVSEPQPGVFILDMGENLAGHTQLKLTAPAGTRVSLRYGELLNKDGTLNPMTSVCGQIKRPGVGGPGAPPVAWQTDTYIARGKGEEQFESLFSFHAFRYVEIKGYPGKPRADAFMALQPCEFDYPPICCFSCSNDLLNRIQAMCDRTFRSNLFSVQSDCPHRERFAYGGDIAATSEALMMNYDMATFYAKTVCDFADAARDDGMLTDTAPFVGIQYCGPAWAMAHPLLVRQLYRYYGDRRLVEQQYEVSRRWLDLVAAKYPDHIVTDGLSDHEALIKAPPPVMVTPLYAESARLVSEMAAILGRKEETEKYRRLADNIRDAYLKKFQNQTTGLIEPSTQASLSFALYENLLTGKQRQPLVEALQRDIRGPNNGHLTTGIFGTKFMLDVLSCEGHAETAYTIVNQRTCPGWGYMLDQGATTLWEHWKGSDNTFSHNHPMFGSVSQWFYHWLGGIQPEPDAVGFDRVAIRPQCVKDLDWVKCSYNSVRGPIVSNWRRDGRRLRMEVEIPVGVTATVYVPDKTPRQVQVGSGRHEFEVSAEK